MVSKARYIYSYKEGKKAEDKFKELMLSRGNTCVDSTRNENIHKHIDFYVNNIPVDVKGNRHIETIWLEIKNVKGNKGWLQGDAEYIVFDIVELKAFCFYKTKDLLKFVSGITEIAESKKDYLKLYTRENRKDVLVKATHKDILHLEQQRLFYE